MAGAERTDDRTQGDRVQSYRARGRTRILPVGVVVFTTLGAVALVPDLLLGLDRISPFAQTVSFRPHLLLAGLLVLALLSIVAAFRRPVRPYVVAAAAVLLVGSAMVLPRVVADRAPAAGPTLTVLSLNTFDGRADVSAVAELIRTERPDVVSLTEAGERYRSRLAPEIEPFGYVLRSTSDDATAPDVQHVTVAIAAELADGVAARVGRESGFPHIELSGGGLESLRFVAFHAFAPVPDQLAVWLSDLALLKRWCAGPDPAIIAGDLNATLDHSALRDGMAGCQDAAAQRGRGLVPTWGPGPVSRTIGPQIDHVLSTDGTAAVDVDILDVDGSDHRAVMARLRLPVPLPR